MKRQPNERRLERAHIQKQFYTVKKFFYFIFCSVCCMRDRALVVLYGHCTIISQNFFVFPSSSSSCSTIYLYLSLPLVSCAPIFRVEYLLVVCCLLLLLLLWISYYYYILLEIRQTFAFQYCRTDVSLLFSAQALHWGDIQHTGEDCQSFEWNNREGIKRR